MSTEAIACTSSQLLFPQSSYITHRIPSPRFIDIFSPVPASFAAPRTPPLSPTLTDLPLKRKRSRSVSAESDIIPSTPPSKRVRSDVNLAPGEQMEGVVSVAKGELITGHPLSDNMATPLFAGGAEAGRQRKMRLTLCTNLSTTPSHSSGEIVTPSASEMPSSPSSLPSPRSSSSRQSSPPTLPSVMSIKRNPKRLSLAIPTQEAGPSTITIARSLTPPSDTDSTPFTPGPPQTPSATMTLGRLPKVRRPTLLSLITHRSSSYDVPPTPGMSHAYALPRRRSNTTEDTPALGVDPRSSRSAHPRLSSAFNPIRETGLRLHSPTTSSSHTASLSSTPSSSPSLSHIETPHVSRSAEPYANGPVEIVPGVFLGAEDSMYHWSTWARSSRVRILNVAQEIDDPFAAEGIVPVSRKGKGKVQRAVYAADEGEGRPEVEYCHLAWSHGESGLAELDGGMQMSDVVEGRFDEEDVMGRERWRFWEAIRYMEEGRQRGEAVLIHCQCGVSRSATLVIAYTMALAASGRTPRHLGHLKGMQDSYDFIKAKSCWIGPNVSLVFQLVEFARNLTTLLSAYHLSHPTSARHIQTSFPSAEQAAQTEADWARQRAQFDQDNFASPLTVDPSIISPSVFSPSTGDSLDYLTVPATAAKIRVGLRDMNLEEGMRKEADLLDEAMRVRRLGRA